MVDKIEMLNKIENVGVNVHDKQGKTRTILIRNNIFRPVEYVKDCKKRWDWIHKFVKEKIVHTGLSLLRMIIGRWCVKSLDDIPVEPCNNLLRIFYWSYLKGVEHSFNRVIMDWNYKKGYKSGMSRYEHLNLFRSKRSYQSRLLILNLLMTEILEDTFDRAVVETAMLETYHQLNKLYKNKVPSPDEFVVYDSHEGRDIEYFLKKIKDGVWVNPDTEHKKGKGE